MLKIVAIFANVLAVLHQISGQDSITSKPACPPTFCAEIYAPVCAYDTANNNEFVTFSNECELNSANGCPCNGNRYVFFQNGECPQKTCAEPVPTKPTFVRPKPRPMPIDYRPIPYEYRRMPVEYVPEPQPAPQPDCVYCSPDVIAYRK